MQHPTFNYFAHNPAAELGTIVTGVGIMPGQTILEAAAPSDAALGDFAGQQMRSAAMACVLSWIEGGDFSYDAMLAACMVICDMDGDGELSDDEQDHMNDCLQGCADALLSLGADSGNVASFLDGEDDEAGASLGGYLSDKMSATTKNDDEIIANYAVGGDLVLESVVKVVRSGKVVLKRKRIGRPNKITAIQRASLKAARMRAFTGVAKLHRAKSMKIRSQRGLK